jgi:hypothetical protein
VWKENYEKRALNLNYCFSYSVFFFYIYARFFFVIVKNSFFLIIFLRSLFTFLFFSKSQKNFWFTKMFDLTIFLNETSEMKIDTMIEKLKCYLSAKKYRMQITILDRIVQTKTILDEKMKRFWKYVIDDAKNWRFHHSIILNFVAIYFVISKIVNAVKKKEMFIKKRFTSSSDFEKRRNTSMRSINRSKFFETWKKSSLKTDQFTTLWRRWSKQSNIDWKFKKKSAKEDHFDQRRLNQSDDEDFHVVAFVDWNEDHCHHVVVVRCAFKRKEKSRNNFHCSFFFDEVDFRKEEKKSKNNSRCSFLFDDDVFD